MTAKSANKDMLAELIFVFLKLGFTAFGGPAAAVAMMRQEFVLKRQWLSEDEFLDFMGVSNLIPGPNATELAIYIGYQRIGWLGLILAGVCYFAPAAAIVLGFARVYTRYGSLPSMVGLLYGIKPVIIAILLHALWGMLKHRLKRYLGLGIATVVFAAYLLGVGPLPLLLGSGVLFVVIKLIKNKQDFPHKISGLIPFFLPMSPTLGPAVPFSLLRLFWVFLKAGALMYGSGYVLLAFIQDDLVKNLGWLSQGQLIDAIAIGQVTPGPLSTTVTFVGFITGGLPGALLATIAMFLPGFIFVFITHPFISKLRRSDISGSFLDGVIFASLGLWAGVTWEIAGAAWVDLFSLAISVIGLLLLLVYNLNSSWLILGGALVGLLRMVFQ